MGYRICICDNDKLTSCVIDPNKINQQTETEDEHTVAMLVQATGKAITYKHLHGFAVAV